MILPPTTATGGPTSNPAPPPAPSSSTAAGDADEKPPSLALSIHKIFCIGGAEIYRQILALSTAPQTPTSDTTDTEGEGEGEFEVRILQTQVRLRERNRGGEQDDDTDDVDDGAFECDTFFPDVLPSDPTIKSAKWKPVSADRLRDWVGEGVELPQLRGGTAQNKVDEEEDDQDRKWFRDEKANVDIRVVGWERR